jgi:hypothetical protein
MPQCHALSKRNREQCKKDAVVGGTVCHIHGGKSLSGMASPSFKTGRYSKVLPVRLAARYEEALTNKNLISLRDDIAAAEARLSDLFSRTHSGESGALWQALRETLDAFTAALTARDGPRMNQHLATIRTLVTQGTQDDAAWREILRLWEVRCRLTATEAKTMMALQQMVSTEQLMVYFGVITDVIKRTVQAYAAPAVAQHILSDLSQEFHRISLRESGAQA